MHDIQHVILPFIEKFSSYDALIAFMSAFGETLIGLGWLLPGSTILLVMGVLAGQGYMDITVVMSFGILGAWLGDSTNYYLGKRYGTVLLHKPQLHIPESNIKKAHDFLNSYGAKSVFFSRFIPGLKETIPFLAGSAQMDRKKFVVWNFLGAIGWSIEFIGIGYLFSSSISLAQALMERSVVVISILVGFILILWILKRFLQANIPMILLIFAGMRDGLMQSRPVRNLINRYPETVSFIKKRFDHNHFTGFPLTVLVFAFVYVLILFGGIVEDFLTKDPIIYLDHIVANLMAQWRTPGLIHFFTWVTYLGREPVVVAVVLTISVIFVLYRLYDSLISFYTSLAGSIFFLWLGKLAFHRPRPEMALYFEPTFSFPSGHATIAVSLYGFIGYLLMRNASTIRAKLNIFFLTTVLIIGIGFSRIYLGEHYLSDVYAGFLLGTLWAILGVAVFKWMKYRSVFHDKTPHSHSLIFSSLLIVMMSVVMSLYLYTHPYRLAIHKQVSPIEIKVLKHYFMQQNNRFCRNLLGIKSLPISILIIGNKNPCTELIEKGWDKISKTKMVESPLFWHAQEPFCKLAQESGNRFYLLDIWKPNLLYHKKDIYLATTNALIGRKWGIIPMYLSNLSEVRSNIAKSVAQTLSHSKTSIVSLSPSAIRRYLSGEEYFDDGKIVLITEQNKK